MESTNNPRHRVDAGMRPFSSKRISRLLGFSALMVWLAPNAQANAGTPLLWATGLHLFFGNVVIGAFEGALLVRLFNLKKSTAIWSMIAANYFPAFAGVLLLQNVVVPLISMDLNNGSSCFWFLVALAYLGTLILEWPFVARCFRGSKDWLRRSWKANLLAQTASYAVLFFWYAFASSASLYAQFQVVSLKDLLLPESIAVFYIAERDGNVYERYLSGGEVRLLYKLNSLNLEDRVFVRPAASNQTNRWDLVARMEVGDRGDGKLVEIKNAKSMIGFRDPYAAQSPPTYQDSWHNFGSVPQLGDAAKSDWEFRSGFWAAEGLRGTNPVKQASFRFAHETVFGGWAVRNAVHLPGDLVLFQLGANQICVLDPNTKRVALLAHGRGPVAVIPTAMK